MTRFIDGAGGNTLLTAVGTDPARYEVWIAGAPGGPLWTRAERAGVTTVKLGRLRAEISPREDVLTIFALTRLIRRERFSIVHTHSTKAGFIGRLAAALARVPVVVHTIHGFAFHPFMSARRRWAYISLERAVRPLTDAFIAVAPQVARDAIELRLAPPGAVSVVPSAVELDATPYDTDGGLRSALGVAAEEPIVGTVGRLDFQKAPLDFVRMAAIVAASRPDTRFVMVGQGELLEDARAEALRLGVEITFAGFRADAARLAADFDVFVVSSLYEGLGRALTEALASARPVVATRVNGVVDVVEPGATGLLAPPARPEILARKVIWLLDHPAEARRMGIAARARVRRLFAPRDMCEQIERIYARLLGPPTWPPRGREAPAQPIWELGGEGTVTSAGGSPFSVPPAGA